MRFCLWDQLDRKSVIRGTIKRADGVVLIRPDGCGDACSQDGSGFPVLVELYGGDLRVVVWSDINQEDPTHIISLKGAAESLRLPESADPGPTKKVLVPVEQPWLDAVKSLQQEVKKLADREASGEDVSREYGDLDEVASELLRNVDLTPAEAPPKE
jgi:hypothetical protein